MHFSQPVYMPRVPRVSFSKLLTHNMHMLSLMDLLISANFHQCNFFVFELCEFTKDKKKNHVSMVLDAMPIHFITLPFIVFIIFHICNNSIHLDKLYISVNFDCISSLKH